MQVVSHPRQRGTRPIVLSGVLCLAVVLTGCGDDEQQRRLSPQVTAADGVYRTSNGGSPGATGVTTWRTGQRGSTDDRSDSDSERDANRSRNGGAGSESEGQHSSQRGGFGSSGHGFFHFGG